VNESGVSSHVYAGAGFYNVKLTVTNSAGESEKASTFAMVTVPVNQVPIAYLNCSTPAPYEIRCNSQSSFDIDGHISSFSYDWGDGAITYSENTDEVIHIYKQTGSIPVTLTATDNDGGILTKTQSYTILENHIPNVAVNCFSIKPQHLTCYSNSDAGDQGDNIVEYVWDWGDGQKESTLMPSLTHTYSASGVFNVSLTTKDQFGGINSAVIEVNVMENQAPIATLNCYVSTGTTYRCDSNAYDPDGEIVESIWTIENQSFNASTIVYNFSNGGDYEISLALKDNLGKIANYSNTISINKPIASFSCLEIYDLTYKCNAVNSNPNQNVQIYSFDVDGQKIYNGQSVTFRFNNFGSHVITLTEISSSGETATYTQNLNIEKKYLPPIAYFKSLVETRGQTTFNAEESLLQSRTVLNYEWDFGDGLIAKSAEPLMVHTYQTLGNYLVKLTVTDELGAKNTYSENVFIFNPEVEDPGELGDSTLLGIDSDGDGVRDDVQRWINFESKDNIALKSVLRKYAQNWQSLYANLENSDQLTDLLTKRSQIQVCLDGVVNDQNIYDHLVEIMEYINTYTEIRNQAWDTIKVNQSGNTFSIKSSDQVEKLKACKEI